VAIDRIEHKSYRFKRIRDDDHHDNQQRKQSKLTSSKNALMLLHEVKPSIEYKLIAQTGPSHRPMFTMAVEINGQIFEGIAQTKKEAKQAAAEKALQSISELEISTDSHLSNPIKHEDSSLSDRIAKYLHEKFDQLTENDVRLQRRKVLSGVVLTHHLQSMEIICITTGTKSISYDHRMTNGQCLNDCHAEIIARRCLIRYCYEQLKLILNENSDQSIFERIKDTNRFRIKSSIDIHLYISTAPCGDSRIYSGNQSQDLNSSLHKSRGLLRRKIEVSEGTIPILAKDIYQNIQIWNDEQLVTMSCSDKLCRWNFIGLQGALLSTLIDPIYYTNIIIGKLYHREYLQRALFSRIEERIDRLPIPFELRRPCISNISNQEIRNTIRSSNHALIWNCIDQKCEIIDTLTGLTISRQPSTVSKAALFQQWMNLMSRIKSVEEIPTIYSDAKQLAKDYQTAKMKINQAFETNGLGSWIRKPFEYEQFDVSLLSQSIL
jgi:double stranded RNA-specific editase B